MLALWSVERRLCGPLRSLKADVVSAALAASLVQRLVQALAEVWAWFVHGGAAHASRTTELGAIALHANNLYPARGKPLATRTGHSARGRGRSPLRKEVVQVALTADGGLRLLAFWRHRRSSSPSSAAHHASGNFKTLGSAASSLRSVSYTHLTLPTILLV